MEVLLNKGKRERESKRGKEILNNGERERVERRE